MGKIKYLNKFPSFYELKKLNKDITCIYEFENIIGSGYLRLTYNEDNNKKISLDYLEDTFLHNLYPLKKLPITENEFYELNEKNYNLIIETLDIIYKEIIKNIECLKNCKKNLIGGIE